MNTSDTKPQPCQCLRTKNPYGSIPENPELWLAGIQTASSYWCVRTMGPAGPDHNYVHLARCIPTRQCYEKDEE